MDQQRRTKPSSWKFKYGSFVLALALASPLDLKGEDSLFILNLDKKRELPVFEKIIKKRIQIEQTIKGKDHDLLNNLMLRYIYSLRCRGLSKIEIGRSLNEALSSIKELNSNGREIIFPFLTESERLELKPSENYNYLMAMYHFQQGNPGEAIKLLKVAKTSREQDLLNAAMASLGKFKRNTQIESGKITTANIMYFNLLNYYSDVDLQDKLLAASNDPSEATVYAITNYLLAERYLIDNNDIEFFKSISSFEKNVAFYDETNFWIKWLKAYDKKANKKEEVNLTDIDCYWTEGVQPLQKHMVEFLKSKGPITQLKKEEFLQKIKTSLSRDAKEYQFFLKLLRINKKENNEKTA